MAETVQEIVERLQDVRCDREPFTPDHAKCICRLTNKAADLLDANEKTISELTAQRDALLEVVNLIDDFLSCEGHWEQPDDAKVIVKCGSTTYYGWVLGDLRKARDVSRDVRSAIEALKGK